MDVARKLRERLLGGAILPSTRLPGQRDLARQFGTTVMTIRQALALLEEEGLVETRHGVGTFAADPGAFQDPVQLASFSEESARRGIVVETSLVGLGLRRPSLEAARALGQAEHSLVCLIERLRWVGGVPVIHQRSYLPASMADRLAEFRADIPLYSFLRERLGVVAARSEEVLRPCGLPTRPARLLRARASAAALFSARTTFDPQGVPFLFDEAYIRGDLVQVEIRRVGARERTRLRFLAGAQADAPTPRGATGRGRVASARAREEVSP